MEKESGSVGGRERVTEGIYMRERRRMERGRERRGCGREGEKECIPVQNQEDGHNKRRVE